MALYIDQDIGTTFEGDIIINAKGDVQTADSLQTVKSAVNFVLRTDFGDVAADPSIGCNLGSFIGQPNTEATHQQMEGQINQVMQQEILSEVDAVAHVVPFDVDEALCVLLVAGSFLVSGEIKTVTQDRIAYLFPYIDGEPTPLTI